MEPTVIEKPKSGLPPKEILQTRAAKKKPPKVVIKKAVDSQTLWAVCRATVAGIILVALGAFMSGLGFYADHFSSQRVKNGTVYATVTNHTLRLQFMSLSYIGPSFMAVGAFVLMFACVMTLESRDKHAQVIHEFETDVEDVKRSIGKRRGTIAHKGKRRRHGGDHSFEDDDVERGEKIAGNPSEGPPTIAVPPKPRAGVVNRCFIRDDSKATGVSNRYSTDVSSPQGTGYTGTTHMTMLTIKSELGAGKYPSTSCIDTLSKRADPKALLQRFLEDQSRMVAQSNRRALAKKPFRSLDVTSLDTLKKKAAQPRRHIRSDDIQSGLSVVTSAEVHKEDDSPFSEAPRSDERRESKRWRFAKVRSGAVDRLPSTDVEEFSLDEFETSQQISSPALGDSANSISMASITPDFMTLMTPPIVHPGSLEAFSSLHSTQSNTSPDISLLEWERRKSVQSQPTNYQSPELMELDNDNETVKSGSTLQLRPSNSRQFSTTSSVSSYATVRSTRTWLETKKHLLSPPTPASTPSDVQATPRLFPISSNATPSDISKASSTSRLDRPTTLLNLSPATEINANLTSGSRDPRGRFMRSLKDVNANRAAAAKLPQSGQRQSTSQPKPGTTTTVKSKVGKWLSSTADKSNTASRHE